MEETQPVLFDLPDPPLFLERVKEFVHTGKIVTKDQELCAEVARACLLGMSVRRIAAKFSVSRNTVNAIMAWLESTGKLEPIKQRLAANLLEVASLAQDRMIEMLENGTVPANVLPIMLGVAIDKSQLLTGSATAIVETKRGVSLEDLHKMIDDLPVAASIISCPAEGQSAALPLVPSANAVVPPRDTTGDTTASPDSPVSAPGDDHPGGGAPSAPAPLDPTDSTARNFGQKDTYA